MTFDVIIMPKALEALKAISDRRIRDKIIERIDGLARSPELQGKPLLGGLAGFRSLRAVGQRYRIIYRVEGSQTQVLVVALGLRQEGSPRDVYSLARKLLRLGLIEPPDR